jgi:putative DNA primase/helicase
LRGADLVILNDNDAVGQAHADAIARMSLGIAARVRRLDLAVHWPTMHAGGDVSDWLDAGHTREELEALIAGAPEYEGEASPPTNAVELPELIVNGSDPTATAKDLATLIARRNDFLFNGHRPIHIANEAGCLPRALEVTTEMVRVLAHKICIPTKVRTTKGVVERTPVPLCRDIAMIYLHGLQGSWGLEPFRGIVTAPLLSDDGGIRVASGYDPQSGLWCHGIPNITVPAEPSMSDAECALRKLRQTFRTFPFADAARVDDHDLGVEVVDLTKPVGLDEASFLAAIMTAVCRQSLDLAPAFLCDAPNYSGAGTGKGLLVKAICVIASGVRPSAFTSGHDAEEFDKRLTAALTEARPAVFLDNFNSKTLTSDVLSSVLTESPAMVRPMGHTKVIPLHIRTFIGIAGNSVQIAEDMARRLLNTQMDARMENPEQREFVPGFLDHIFVERANLLAAALTIWRWGRHSKPKPGKALGSYEVWAQWCRDPLLALGMRDPVDRITEIKAADPKRRALVANFHQWWAAHGDLMVKAKDLAGEVIKAIDDKATVSTDGNLQYSRQRVAGFLAGHINTRVGGYALTKVMLGPPSKEIAHYKLTHP